MRKLLLLLFVVCFVAACNKTPLPDAEGASPNSIFTDDELAVLTRHLLGETRNEAEVVGEATSAMEFLDQSSVQTRSVARRIENIEAVTSLRPTTRGGESDAPAAPIYVVNFADDMGYAVLSADRRTDATWAMASSGNLDLDKVDDFPPALHIFFANMTTAMERQVDAAEELKARLLDEALAKLAKLETENNGSRTRNADRPLPEPGPWEIVDQVPPLVKVTWGQGAPYNNDAPLINGQHALAGCVAVAIAQIMSYHRYPTSYNWAEINRTTTVSSSSIFVAADVARMFRTIGDNIGTKWGLAASGALSCDAPTHFKRMGYRNTGSYGPYNFNSITVSVRMRIPVIMGGFAIKEGTDYKSGHDWIVDGYLKRRRQLPLISSWGSAPSYEYEELVHCNIGWGGDKNGYYNNAAFDLNKGPVSRSGEPYNFQFKLDAVYNIKP